MKIVTAAIVEIIGAVIYGAQHNTGSETMGPICSAFVAADISFIVGASRRVTRFMKYEQSCVCAVRCGVASRSDEATEICDRK